VAALRWRVTSAVFFFGLGFVVVWVWKISHTPAFNKQATRANFCWDMRMADVLVSEELLREFGFNDNSNL
jgi:hypothetical protein